MVLRVSLWHIIRVPKWFWELACDILLESLRNNSENGSVNGKWHMCMLRWFPSQDVFWPRAERKKHNFQAFLRKQLAEVNMVENCMRWEKQTFCSPRFALARTGTGMQKISELPLPFRNCFVNSILLLKTNDGWMFLFVFGINIISWACLLIFKLKLIFHGVPQLLIFLRLSSVPLQISLHHGSQKTKLHR